MKDIKTKNLKVILALLFFEQGFFSNHPIYQVKIFSTYSKHSFLEKRVSDFLFSAKFTFYAKKRVTFVYFLKLFFNIA